MTNQRQLDDWISGYMTYAKDTEPPTSFHRWTAIGCIASALQRKVRMPWGMETIYPNLYIVLLGPAAQTRKSTALRIGESLVDELSIPMIGQDNSPEAVIREIKTNVTTVHEASNVRLQCAMTCFASELAVFLGRQNAEFQAYLTDWYDSPEKWKRTTKHQGVDDISGMCFNLIAAMAPDWIPHVFTTESIGGGFTSRIVFVAENKKAQTIANPNKVMPANGLRRKLLHDLELIHRMTGDYKFSKDAEAAYEAWYIEDDRRLQENIYAVDDPAFQTYCGRRATLARKVSMCLAASRSSELVIEAQDFVAALTLMEETEKRMAGIFGAVGRSQNSHQLASTKRVLQAQGSIKRSELLRQLHHDMSADDLEGIEKTLEASKLIKVTRLAEESDTLYDWLGERD